MTKSVLKSFSVTALSIAAGIALATPPRMLVHSVSPGIQIAETLETIAVRNAFTKKELQLAFTNNPEGCPELGKALKDGLRPHIFVAQGGKVECYQIVPPSPKSKAVVTLTMPDDLQRPWDKTDCAVIKV